MKNIKVVSAFLQMAMRIVMVVLMAMALLQTSCTNKPARNIHYLIIVNEITDEVVNAFTEKFEKGDWPLAKMHNISEGNVTFTVFLTTASNARAEVSFSPMDLDRKIRRALADSFMVELNKLKVIKIPQDRYILQSHQFLLREISDTNTTYRILNAAGLVENSGGAISVGGNRENALNGYFHFSTGQDCEPGAVTEAKRQLEDPSSALYKNFIERNKSNPLLAKQKIYYVTNETGLHKTEGGCGSNDVIAFWEKLYTSVQLTPEQYARDIKAFLQE